MQPISPDVNEAASLLFLELLDACNHLVVQTVSIRSPSKSIDIGIHYIIPVNSGRDFPCLLLRSWSKTLAFW